MTKQNTHDFLNTSILDALVSLLDAVLVRHIVLGPVYRGPGYCFFEKNFPPGLTKKCLYAYLKMRFIKGSFNPQSPYPSAADSVGGRGDCGLKHPLVVVGQEKIHTYMACGTVPVSFEEAGICFLRSKNRQDIFFVKKFR